MPLIPTKFKFDPALPPAAVAAFKKFRDNTWCDVTDIMAAVEYPEDPVGPRADMLTKAQRAAVELITELKMKVSNNEIDTQMPRRYEDQRSWLGLDRPQPLDKLYAITVNGKRTREPGWRALKLLKDVSDTAVKKWLASVPLGERLAMWGQVNLGWPRSWDLDQDDFFDPGDDKLIKKLKAEGKKWAPAFCDQLLAAKAEGTFPDDVPLLPILALVRAGLRIEPRWDSLVPIHKDYLPEILKGLPEERRGPALVSSLRSDHPGSALGFAKWLLPLVPDPAIAEYAVSCIPKAVGSPKQHLADLAVACAKHPAALAVIHAAQGKRPAAPNLTTTKQRDVGAEGKKRKLSKIDEAQLLASGRAYFGKKLPLKKLLSDDEHSEETLLPILTYRALSDAKGPAYDVWEYAGDSGTVFKAGTTKQVAFIAQGTVESKDAGLADALEDAVRQKATKKKSRR